jgi:prepilin-type N-terminal cleavage/methylation domain-containing protein
MTYHHPRSKAFTLVETLVAVSILALSVAGPLYTANHATVLTKVVHDRVTASYLAQEGVEYVRAVRDSAFLADQAGGWNAFLTTMTSCATSCLVDPYSENLQACTGSSCTPLYVANNRYTISSSGGVVTPFTRTLSYTAATDTLLVQVAWDHHGVPHTVQIVEQLRPWQ